MTDKPSDRAMAAAWELLDWLVWVEDPTPKEVEVTARALDTFARVALSERALARPEPTRPADVERVRSLILSAMDEQPLGAFYLPSSLHHVPATEPSIALPKAHITTILDALDEALARPEPAEPEAVKRWREVTGHARDGVAMELAGADARHGLRRPELADACVAAIAVLRSVLAAEQPAPSEPADGGLTDEQIEDAIDRGNRDRFGPADGGEGASDAD